MKNEKLKVKNGRACLLALFTLLFSVSAFAQERVVDNAGVLNAQQKANLTELINLVASEYNFDLVIVTERSIGGTTIGNYALDFFTNNGYGSGLNRDGCILLQVTEDRNYWLEPSGRGKEILKPAAFNKLDADTSKNLAGGSSYEAYRAYVLNWQEFLKLEAKGRNYNFFHQWNALLVVIAWIIALGIGFCVVALWKGQMNTALSPSQAGAYAVPGSLAFAQKKDTFLSSKKTQTLRQSSSASSAASLRGGGGSRTSGRGGRY